MTPRSQALNVISMRTNGTSTNNKTLSASDIFGIHVFNRQAMAKMLPKYRELFFII